MTDNIDKANEIMAQTVERALTKRRQNTTASRLFCEDCETAIPELRRQKVIGCTRCIDCQTIYEHQMRNYRK